MSDRPIIFSAPMVRALLDGRKTQTRRLARRPPEQPFHFLGDPPPVGKPSPWQRVQPGDRLWVREAWSPGYESDPDGLNAPDCDGPPTVSVIYRADMHEANCIVPYEVAEGWRARYGADGPDDPIVKPSIHMPRWASRLTLTVTEVRVQRLQEISEADAQAEGMPITWDGKGYDPPPNDHWQGYGRACFCLLWSELHGPGAWEANPEVVCLSFTVERKNIDE